MDFVASFVEIIAMVGLLVAIIFGLFYCMRHRTRINRWIENYGAKDNAVEKETRVRALRRKIEDAEAEITDLESVTPTEKE